MFWILTRHQESVQGGGFSLVTSNSSSSVSSLALFVCECVVSSSLAFVLLSYYTFTFVVHLP